MVALDTPVVGRTVVLLGAEEVVGCLLGPAVAAAVAAGFPSDALGFAACCRCGGGFAADVVVVVVLVGFDGDDAEVVPVFDVDPVVVPLLVVVVVVVLPDDGERALVPVGSVVVVAPPVSVVVVSVAP